MRLLKAPLLLLLLLAVPFAITACDDDDHHETRYIVNGKLVQLPPGGNVWGGLNQFDNVQAERTITSISEADGFQFTLTDLSHIVISCESLSTGLNPFIELYDAAGTFVSSDDDSGNGWDALIVARLNPGRYNVLAWAAESGPSSGSYELNILVGATDGDDLGEMAVNDAQQIDDIEIFAGDDALTYVFTLPANAKLEVEVVQQLGGLADIGLQLVDQRGAIVTESDPTGIDPPGILGLPLNRGTYILVVSNAASGGAGTINLRVAIVP